MVSLKNIKINTLIDLVSFTPAINIGEIERPDQIGDFEHKRDYPIKVLHQGKKKNTYKPCHCFLMIAVYTHSETGNRAHLCYKRKNYRKKDLIPSFKVTFESSHRNPLQYTDVEKAVKDLGCLGTDLRVSAIHLAIDFVNQKQIKLHKIICRRIKPGRKSKFKPSYTTYYYGSPRSGCILAIYDKAKQLSDKKEIIVTDDISRVEIRIKVPALNNFVTCLEDIGKYNWLWFYNRHFSFHYPNHKILDLIGKKRATKKTIWELRDFIAEEFGITSSNFYRDYLRDHSILAPLTIRALDKFRWNQKSK